MPAQIFGAEAIAIQLYQAFFGAAPSNPLYVNYTQVIRASSPQSFALTLGNQFSTVSDANLATSVLTNLGITATSVPAASYTALLTALTQAFAAYPTQRGLVVLNLANILTGLETDVTFGSVSQVFNQSVTASYVYASNKDNTQTQSLGGITTTSPLTVNAGDLLTGTAGNDNINGNLFFNTPSGTFFQTLNSGDTVNGGAGTDTLTVGLNNGAAQSIAPTLTSIETIAINATGTATTSIDMVNSTGLANLSLANSTSAAGSVVISSLSTVLSTISMSNTQAGILVLGTTATNGTADTVAVNLNQVGTPNVTATILTLPGYETININSTGPATNVIGLSNTTGTQQMSAGAVINVTGTTTLAINTQGQTNALTINASGMTGTAALSVTSAGRPELPTANAAVTITGTANNDTFNFFRTDVGLQAYSTADVVNGGAGTDTIGVGTFAAVGVSANQTNLSNLEILSLLSATAAGTYTPAAFGGATTLQLTTASAAAYTVNYGAGTAGLNLQADQGAATVNSAGSATTDVLNVALGTSTTAGVTVGALASTGFETINVASNGAVSAANATGNVTMAASAAVETLNVSGARNLTVGTVQADVVNASTMTGNLVMTGVSLGAGLTAGVPVTNAGMQITGGAGADTLFGSDGADQIAGGAGADRIRFGSAGTNQGDIVTGGDGADRFAFEGAAQSQGTAQIVKITDFVAGTDKIALTFGPTAVTMGGAVTVATADTLTQVWAGVGASTGTAADANVAAKIVTVSAGLASGTYLYVDANDDLAAASAADMLINISGVTGTVTAGDFVFTLAA
ncbi:beta strand repeat-containing protein [Ramlibacter sp.]|uniref:beta strand repeat-containing protein n=1 Tax=Ramlibacter sp. TaxID=1917967 RepID=UPI003D0DFDD8